MATDSSLIRRRIGSGCSPGMEKIVRTGSPKSQQPYGFFDPSLSFSMAKLLCLTRREFLRFQLLQEDKGEPVLPAVFDWPFSRWQGFAAQATVRTARCDGEIDRVW